MTEGRRSSLRKLLAEPNAKIRAIMREQAKIEAEPEGSRDNAKWLELQEEYSGIMLETVDPAWVTWGVKQIEGLEVDSKTLTLEDWQDWPSALFNEVLEAVKSESELNGAERKNSESPTTSGEPGGGTLRSLTAPPAGAGGSSGTETAGNSFREE
jgi:hypothetical protein